jgi:putative endopeptidase
MTHRLGSLLLLAVALGCASTEAAKAPAAASPGAAPPAGATASAPDAGMHGVDLAGMDRSVPPGEDFFLHANGTWLEETEIPADSSRWGTFNILADHVDAACPGRAGEGS